MVCLPYSSWRKRLCAPVLLAATLIAAGGCTERTKDDPDRRPGPQPDVLRTNADEGRSNGRGLSPATGPAMTIDERPLKTIDEVVSQPNALALTGRQVQFSAEPVQRVLSSQYVVIGSSDDRGIVVRLKEALPELKPGERLNITGMIAQLGADLAHWELDQDKKDIVRRYPIFINAVASEPASAP